MTGRASPTAPCPICRTACACDASNRYRPFCSDRCKLLDLGRWFDGTYAVPGEPAVDFDGEAVRQALREAMDDPHAGLTDDDTG